LSLKDGKFLRNLGIKTPECYVCGTRQLGLRSIQAHRKNDVSVLIPLKSLAIEEDGGARTYTNQPTNGDSFGAVVLGKEQRGRMNAKIPAARLDDARFRPDNCTSYGAFSLR
jgi:hypothetical protein